MLISSPKQLPRPKNPQIFLTVYGKLMFELLREPQLGEELLLRGRQPKDALLGRHRFHGARRSFYETAGQSDEKNLFEFVKQNYNFHQKILHQMKIFIQYLTSLNGQCWPHTAPQFFITFKPTNWLPLRVRRVDPGNRACGQQRHQPQESQRMWGEAINYPFDILRTDNLFSLSAIQHESTCRAPPSLPAFTVPQCNGYVKRVPLNIRVFRRGKGILYFRQILCTKSKMLGVIEEMSFLSQCMVLPKRVKQLNLLRFGVDEFCISTKHTHSSWSPPSLTPWVTLAQGGGSWLARFSAVFAEHMAAGPHLLAVRQRCKLVLHVLKVQDSDFLVDVSGGGCFQFYPTGRCTILQDQLTE